MKVTCHSCGAKYAIADDKVRGRRVKVRCKSCTTAIVVDGNALEADAAAAALGGGDDDEATRIAPGAAAPGADEWSVNLSDTDQRTMTEEEIVAGWRSGLIREDAFVWKDGMDDWKPVLEVPELASRFFERHKSSRAPAKPASVPAPAAAKSSPPWQQQAQRSGNGSPAPGAVGGGFGFGATAGAAAAQAVQPRSGAARVAGGRAHGRDDLFSKVNQAGSEADASSHPAPGSTAYEEAKPTGARNENSVLFSLDALKAGFTPSAQAVAAPSRPVAQQMKPSDTANLDDLMNLGSSSNNALFGFSANQALMNAPPPPPEPVAPPPSFAAPTSYDPSVYGAHAAPKSNKLFMIIAAVVAILLVVGVGLAFVIGSSKGEAAALAEKEKQALEESKRRDLERDRERAEARKREAEAAKRAETPKDDPAAPKTEEEAKKLGKPITEEDRKRFAEAKKKKEEEGKTAPEETAKDEPKKEVSASFNKGAAISALSSAASAASGCKRPDGPTGSGRAVVTFAPSGNVTSATVSGGSFGGTSVGGCIASVFRRAKIPPFEGGPVTVSKSFSISP